MQGTLRENLDPDGVHTAAGLGEVLERITSAAHDADGCCCSEGRFPIETPTQGPHVSALLCTRMPNAILKLVLDVGPSQTGRSRHRDVMQPIQITIHLDERDGIHSQ